MIRFRFVLHCIHLILILDRWTIDPSVVYNLYKTMTMDI